MRGAVFAGSRRIELITLDDPIPGPYDAVIEIKASGLCGSDLRYYRTSPAETLAALGVTAVGDGSVIGGHEPCGVVAAIGSEVDRRVISVGQRVMVYHYDGCGFCELCRTGWIQMCERGAVVFGATAHGGHAEYMKVPARVLIPLADELSFAGGAAISCGTGTAYAALTRLGVTARDTVAVFGQGPVGQSAVQIASVMGATVIAVDVEATRVGRAQEFGANHAVDSSVCDPVEAIREFTGGKGATRTLDASGSPAGRQGAVRSAARWGTVAFVGEGGQVTLEVSPDLIRKQLTVFGSWTFSIAGQAECARFIAEHGIDVDKLFTSRWSLDDAGDAYREFDRQSGGKALIEF